MPAVRNVQNIFTGREQNASRAPTIGALARRGRTHALNTVHFIRPAAVSARVITLPTSTARRRCLGGSARLSFRVGAHNVARFGAAEGADGGMIVALSIASGLVAGVASSLRSASVRPKKSAMW